MQVQIIATKDCNHRQNLERELNALDIPYKLVFVEDQPDEAQRLGIRHSPNLVVDGEVAFRCLPSEADLRAYFAKRK